MNIYKLNEQVYLKSLSIDELDKLGLIEFCARRYYTTNGYVMRYYAVLKDRTAKWQISFKEYKSKVKINRN